MYTYINIYIDLFISLSYKQPLNLIKISQTAAESQRSSGE